MFIQLTSAYDNTPVDVNISFIEAITPRSPNYAHTRVITGRNTWEVTEAFEAVREKIRAVSPLQMEFSRHAV